jgi:hypothetical protein
MKLSKIITTLAIAALIVPQMTWAAANSGGQLSRGSASATANPLIVSPVNNSIVSNTIKIQTTIPTGIPVKIYVNNQLVRELPELGASYSLDTTILPNGPAEMKIQGIGTNKEKYEARTFVTIWNEAKNEFSSSTIQVQSLPTQGSLDFVDASLVRIKGKNDESFTISSFGGPNLGWRMYKGNVTNAKNIIWEKSASEMFGVTRKPAPEPYDHFWLVKAYQQKNKVLGFLHVEHKADGTDNDPLTNNNASGTTDVYEGRLSLAWSEDYGNTWKLLGDYMRPYDPVATINPAGAPYIVKDGYFYSYYVEAIPRGDGKTQRGVAVVRAKVADVWKAAEKGGVTPWKKFYQGKWESDGLKGPATALIDVVTEGHVHTDAFYSITTKKYYLLLARSASIARNRPSVLNLFESTDGVQWRLAKNIATRPMVGTVSGSYDGYHYPFVTVPGTANDIMRAAGTVVITASTFTAGNNKKGHPLQQWKVSLSSSRPAVNNRETFERSISDSAWTYSYSKQSQEVLPMVFDEQRQVWSIPDTNVTIDNSTLKLAGTSSVWMKWQAPADGVAKVVYNVDDVNPACGDPLALTLRYKTIQLSNSSKYTGSINMKAGQYLVFSARLKKNTAANAGADCNQIIWQPNISFNYK